MLVSLYIIVVWVGEGRGKLLSEESFSKLLENLIEGYPEPGSQKKRFSSEPEGFLNSTKVKIEENNNASVKLFLEKSIRKKTKKLMSER